MFLYLYSIYLFLSVNLLKRIFLIISVVGISFFLYNKSVHIIRRCHMSGLLKNKNIVVMGVANQRSISCGITKSLHEAGSNLIFTNRSERSYKKLAKLLENNDIKASHMTTCDVASDESIEHAFKDIHEHVGVIHGVVHSVAFANTEDLQGNYSDTSRDGYLLAQEISSYSLVAVTRAAKPYMTEGGSIVTQTYIGAE